ncbi:ElaB/YgaM/YqjD family protein [Pseudomonas sp. X10]
MARKTTVQTESEQIKDQAFSELQALIEESEKLLNDSASLVGEEAETLRAQISLKLSQARDAVNGVRSKAQPVVEATQEYIGDHPWQTVAISAGLGLVVGLLLGRRN